MELMPLYQSALDSVDDAICIFDQQMKILFMNQAAEDLTGFSLASAAQKECWEVFSFLDSSDIIKEAVCGRAKASNSRLELGGDAFSLSVTYSTDGGEAKGFIIALKRIPFSSPRDKQSESNINEIVLRHFSMDKAEEDSDAKREANRPVQVTSISFVDDQGREMVAQVNADISERLKSEDELRKKDRLLAGVAIAANLLVTEDRDFAIYQALEILGFSADVDRAYISEINDIDLRMTPRFEWAKETIPSHVKGMQGHTQALFPQFHDQLSSGKPVKGLVQDLPSSIREAMESLGVRSFLIVPIALEGKLWGFIGLDDCHNNRIWSLSEVSILMAVAGIMGGSLARWQVEDDVINAHQRLLQIIEFLPDATFVIDRDKKVIAWNLAIEEMTGVGKEQIVGKGGYAYSLPFYGKPRPMLVDLLETIDRETESKYPFVERKGNNLYTEVFVPSLFDGRGAYLWAIASPLYGNDGKLIGFIESMRDITERKNASQELEKRDLLLSGVAVAANALLIMHDFDAGINQALEILGLSAHVDRVYIFENHDDPKTGEHLTSQRFEWCREAVVPQINNPKLQNISYRRVLPNWHKTLELGEAINGLAKDFSEMERSLLEPQDIISILVVPIMIEGIFWGFIGFDECHEERIWTKSEIAILKASAGSIGASIVRRLAEEKLRESEEKFRTLFNSASDAIFIHDLEGHFFEANQAACDRLGYSRKELLQMTLADIEQPEHAAQVRGHIEEVMQAGHKIFESVQMRRDRTILPVEMSARLIEYSGMKAVLCISRDITERKQAEEALRLSESRYRAIVEDQTELINRYRPDGTLTFVNAAFCKYFGKTHEEVVGQSIMPFILKEDRELIKNHLKSLSPEKPVETLEHRVIQSCADVRWHQWTHRAIFEDGKLIEFQSVGRDITERKRAEETREESREFLNKIINSIGDPMFVKDRQHRLILVNDAACKLFGRSREDLLGQTAYDLFSTKEMADISWEKDEEVFITGQENVSEETNTYAPGVILTVLVKKTLYTDAVGNSFLVGITRDITNRKLAEDELRKAKESAESATKAKSEFLANMSHEIRTPMNAVIGMTGLLLDTQLTPEQRDFVETISNSGESLLALINDILDFSKIEGSKPKIESQPYSPKECIESSMDMVAETAAKKGLRISYSTEGSVPKIIMGDATRLGQVLANLLSNAVKFTELGEISILASSEKKGNLNEILFSVKDSGIGIDKDQMAKLFQSFSQLDSSTTRKYGGTGLGLAISKRLVEMMGGKIWAESSLGQGSTFYFTIKAEDAQDIGSTLEMPRTIHARTMDYHPMRILLVEDNLVNQKVAIRMLERIGYRADVAANGLEALNAVLQLPYDIIFMDVQMPEMDGLEATRQIRLSSSNQPYIIAMTAHALKGDREKCLDSGMDDYISKPVKIEELRIALERAGQRQKPKPALDQDSIDNLRLLQMAGEPDILGELGGLFLDRAPLRIKAMRDALSNGDPEMLYREAHNLKSSSANLGAVRLSEICRDLEATGRSGRLGSAQELADQAAVEFERVKEALQAEIAKGAGISI